MYALDVRGRLSSHLEGIAGLLDPSSEGQEQAGKDGRAAYTVQHAYENTEFYEEWLDEHDIDPYDVESVGDLAVIPVIDGDTILANQPPSTRTHRLVNDDADIRRLYHTSGSTGRPKEILKSYDEYERIASDAGEGFAFAGVSAGDHVVNYFPFAGMNPSGIGAEGGIHETGAMSIPISNTPYPTDAEAGILQAHAPSDAEREDGAEYILMGLPSHIDAKGKQFETEGFDPAAFGIDRILLAGEPVSDARKQNISTVYDAEVREFLGTTESGGFAYECLEGEGLHVLDRSVHVDVVDPDTGKPVDTGEGRLVITNLLEPGEESAMPLVRYDVGDMVTVQEDASCSCDIDSTTTITPPRRESWDFVLGAVNLNPVYFEDTLYSHEELAPVTDEYQLQIDYDPDTGQDVLDMFVESVDDAYHDITAEAVMMDEEPDTVAAELGQDLLNGDERLKDTVTVGGARINVHIVEELDTGPKKPQRLIDQRDR